MKQYIRKQLKIIDTIAEFDEQAADELRTIADAAIQRAAHAGIHVEGIGRPGGISVALCRRILAACIAGLPDAPSDTVSLSEAARILGMSESGLRKLVRRGAIRYSQARKGAAIRFRRDWLNDFVEPPTPVRPQMPKSSKGAFGFRDSLLR